MAKNQKQRKAQGKFELVDPRLVRSLTHPTRVYVLTVLNERMASPKELAEELDQSLSAVAYHVKELASLGVIELAETKPVRGTFEHFYRATARQFFDAESWAQVPLKERHKVTATILEVISRDLNESIQGATFDSSDDNHLSRTPLVLDDAGQQEVVSLLEETLSGLLDIQERASERMTESDETGVPVKVAIMQFRSPGPKA